MKNKAIEPDSISIDFEGIYNRYYKAMDASWKNIPDNKKMPMPEFKECPACRRAENIRLYPEAIFNMGCPPHTCKESQ